MKWHYKRIISVKLHWFFYDCILFYSLYYKLIYYYSQLMLLRKIQQWLNINPAKDKPWKFDWFYRFWSMFKATWVQPSVWINNTRVQDQYQSMRTYNACTCYWIAHCVNEYAYNEWKKEKSKDDREWKDLWEIALSQWASLINWWYLQPALELVRKQWLISWYTLITSKEEAMVALSRGNVLYTWAVWINWSKQWDWVWSKYFIEKWRWWWHAFAIVWYDIPTQIWICKDSAWTGQHNGWYFYLPIMDFDSLATTYALHNVDDAPVFAERKDEILLELALQNRIWNGTNPSKIISKQEWDLVLGRIKSFLEARWIKIPNYARLNMSRKNAVLFLMKKAKEFFKDVKPR